MIRPCLDFASVREAIRQYAVGEQTDGFRIRTAKKVNEYFSCLLFCGSTAGLPKIQQPHDMTVGLETGLPQIAQEFASKREAHAVAVSRDREGEGKERGLLNGGEVLPCKNNLRNWIQYRFGEVGNIAKHGSPRDDGRDITVLCKPLEPAR